jgi:hypothetical protein
VNNPPNCPTTETEMENRFDRTLRLRIAVFNNPEMSNITVSSGIRERTILSGIARRDRHGTVITDKTNKISNSEIAGQMRG